MYSLTTIPELDAIRAFFFAQRNRLPSDVHLIVENAGDIIEDTTGALEGTWSTTAVTGIDGLGSGLYAAPAGYTVSWLTSTTLDGHHVRGRTFIVPANGSVYQSDGTINSTELPGIQADAAALVVAAAGALVVWHRPKFGPRPAGGGSRPLLRDGGHGVITGSSVADRVAVLRTRRD